MDADINERRADRAESALRAVSADTGVDTQEQASTALVDCLAYFGHLCDRFGLDAPLVFDLALRSYEGDFEDGPGAENTLDPTALLRQPS